MEYRLEGGLPFFRLSAHPFGFLQALSLCQALKLPSIFDNLRLEESEK